MLTLPIFYHPSTTLWVDDDSLFLQAVSQLFNPGHLKTFNHPADCLNFMAAYKAPSSNITFLRGAVEDERYELARHAPVDLNVASIYQAHTSQTRRDEISVIIVDHNMTDMTGIALCEKLKHHPAKKILITGQTSHDTAIEAFNDGIIDKFINKASENLVPEIYKYHEELLFNYFQEVTTPLLSHLEADMKLPQSDPAFICFFHHLCQQYKIQEYYLIDKNGSMLLVDGAGYQRQLIIHTNRSLDAFIELISGLQHTESMQANIQRRECIPFFGIGRECWELNREDWNKHLYQPKQLAGRETYLYTLLDAMSCL